MFSNNLKSIACCFDSIHVLNVWNSVSWPLIIDLDITGNFLLKYNDKSIICLQRQLPTANQTCGNIYSRYWTNHFYSSGWASSKLLFCGIYFKSSLLDVLNAFIILIRHLFMDRLINCTIWKQSMIILAFGNNSFHEWQLHSQRSYQLWQFRHSDTPSKYSFQ